jgi:hypothetical protein
MPANSSKKPNEESKSEKSTPAPKARILRQGMKSAPKKPISVVKKVVAPKRAMPTANKPPTGSQQHHTIERPAAGGYGGSMMEKYFGFGKKKS